MTVCIYDVCAPAIQNTKQYCPSASTSVSRNILGDMGRQEQPAALYLHAQSQSHTPLWCLLASGYTYRRRRQQPKHAAWKEVIVIHLFYIGNLSPVGTRLDWTRLLWLQLQGHMRGSV
jgi:hypothetical protein